MCPSSGATLTGSGLSDAGTQELDAALQVSPALSRGKNPFPYPAGHAALDAAQDKSGFLVHISGSCPTSHPPAPTSPSLTAALNLFIPQATLTPGVAPSQVQDFVLGFVETHDVSKLLKLVQVPLGGLASLRHVEHTAQLSVVCTLAVGALDPTVCLIDEAIKQ